jgi:hypothetical protein
MTTNADGEPMHVMTTEAENNAIINLSAREAKFVNNGFDDKNDEDNESDDNESDDQHDNHPSKSWRFGQGTF